MLPLFIVGAYTYSSTTGILRNKKQLSTRAAEGFAGES
jgi:hypothetical protein